MFKKLNSLLVYFLCLSFSATSFAQESPNAQVKIANWNGDGFTYHFSKDAIAEDVMLALTQNLSISGTLTGMVVSDPEPNNVESVPYLVYKILTDEGKYLTFGHRVIRRAAEQGEQGFAYFLDIGELNDLEENPDPDNPVIMGYSCEAPQGCDGCVPVRKGFLGLGGVVSCKCVNIEAGTCDDFKKTGSDFPWAAVIAAAAAIAAAIIAAAS